MVNAIFAVTAGRTGGTMALNCAIESMDIGSDASMHGNLFIASTIRGRR